MPEFKVGDRVYCPDDGNFVCVVIGSTLANNRIVVNGVKMTTDGRELNGRLVPRIVHATPENQSKLEALYGVKFGDAPKPVPVGSDLTRWLLAKHGKPVLCYVSDRSDDCAAKHNRKAMRVVEGLHESGWFVATNGTPWRCAVPVDNATGFTTAADYVAD